MDHAVIDAVQLLLVFGEAFSENLIAFPSRFPLLALGILHQQSAGHGLAAEGKFHPAHEVGVLPNQFVLLNHVFDDLRGHGLALHLHCPEQDGREFLFQLGAEGGVQERGGILNREVLHRGADLIIIFVLRDIKFVHRVDGIAHIGQRRAGLILQHEFLFLLTGGQNLIGGGGVSDSGNYVLHDGADFFDGDSAIRQFGYFHHVFLSRKPDFPFRNRSQTSFKSGFSARL